MTTATNNTSLSEKLSVNDGLQIRATPPSTDPKTLEYLYPKGLSLEQLIVIHRHGDRTPLKPRFPSLLPLSWNFCHGSQQQIAYASQFDPNQKYLYSPPSSDSQIPITFKKYYEHAVPLESGKQKIVQVPPAIHPGTCGYGHLSDIGSETMYRNGTALRKIYGDYLKFLPSHLNDFKPEEVYLRSTDYARTFQSLQQLLKGTFPELSSQNTPDFAIRTRSHDDESLFPNWRCNELNSMIKRFVKTHRGGISKEWNELREDLINNVPELSEMLKKKEYESYLTIHQLFDSFISARAHQLPLPKGFSDKHLRELEKLEVGLWFDMLISSPEDHSADQMNRFMIGKLFGEVKDLMESKVNASKLKSAPKLAIFSGHDTTIAPFLLSIKAFDYRWPAYGSMLMLELFKDTTKSNNPKPNHYVRVKYNQNVLNIPECSKPGNHHPELGKSYCKLDTVKKLFDKFIVDDFEGECKGFKPEMSAV